MYTYVSMLRGINVGGKAMLKIAELVKTYEAMGLKNPRSYIQTGNIIFESSASETALAKKISQKISQEFSVDVEVVIRNAKELKKVLAFLAMFANARTLHATQMDGAAVIERLREYESNTAQGVAPAVATALKISQRPAAGERGAAVGTPNPDNSGAGDETDTADARKIDAELTLQLDLLSQLTPGADPELMVRAANAMELRYGPTSPNQKRKFVTVYIGLIELLIAYTEQDIRSEVYPKIVGMLENTGERARSLHMHFGSDPRPNRAKTRRYREFCLAHVDSDNRDIAAAAIRGLRFVRPNKELLQSAAAKIKGTNRAIFREVLEKIARSQDDAAADAQEILDSTPAPRTRTPRGTGSTVAEPKDDPAMVEKSTVPTLLLHNMNNAAMLRQMMDQVANNGPVAERQQMALILAEIAEQEGLEDLSIALEASRLMLEIANQPRSRGPLVPALSRILVAEAERIGKLPSGDPIMLEVLGIMVNGFQHKNPYVQSACLLANDVVRKTTPRRTAIKSHHLVCAQAVAGQK